MKFSSIIGCLLLAASSLGAANEQQPAVLLDEYAPCGQVSLYLVCQVRGVDVDFPRIEQLTGPADAEGCHSFADLSGAAKEFGLHPVGIRVDRERLMSLPTPAIIHSQNPQGDPRPHLSVLLAATPEGAYLLDPPYTARLVPWSLFEHFWTGNVLVFPENDEQIAEIESGLHSARSFRAVSWTLQAGLAALVAIVVFAVVSTVRRSRRLKTAASTAIQGTKGRLRSKPVWIIAGGLLATAVIAVGAIWLKPAIADALSGAPRLAIEQSLVDLGELPPGAHETTVALHNSGRTPLLISRVESSCSCAVVTRPERIEPGATADLKVNIRVASGRGYANLALESDDPRGPHDVTLQWFGSVQPLLVPRWVSGHDLPLAAPYERIVSVVYPGGQSAVVPELKNVACPEKWVHVESVGNDPTAFRTASDISAHGALGYLNLRLRIDPPAAPGELQTSCLLTVQYGEHEYELKLPIAVEFVGRIASRPAGIVFAAADRAGVKGQTQSVSLAADAAVGLLVVKESPPWLRCQLNEATGPDLPRELRIEVIDAPPESFVAGKVIVAAQDGSTGTIDVRSFAPRKD